MKFTILLLVICAEVLCEEHAGQQEANRRMSSSYTTSIIHGEPKDGHGLAQSSVKVNFNSANGLQNQIESQQTSDATVPYNHKQDAMMKSYMQGFAYPYQAQPTTQSETYEMKPASAQETTYQYQIVQPLQDSTANYQNQIPDATDYMQYANMKHADPVTQIQIQDASYGNLQSQQGSLGQYQNGHASPDARSFTQYQEQHEQLPQALPLQAPAIQMLQDAQPKYGNGNSDSPTYFQYSGTKQIDSYSNPSDQQQLYNVGYSINIENVTPKLMYRVPEPPPRSTFRQQKLLNADVITGTRKEIVEKPVGLTQSINNLDNLQINAVPSNYLQEQNSKSPQILTYHDDGKQQVTRVYADIKNTHGYSWKTLSPGVEISGYHNLQEPVLVHQQTQPQHFDHAAALGRSQGFDISNVVDTGTSHSVPLTPVTTGDYNSKSAPLQTIQYQQPTTTFNKPTYDAINFQTRYQTQPFRQSHSLNIPKASKPTNLHYSSTSNSLQTAQFEPILQTSGKDALNFQQSDIELLNIPTLQHNFGTGSNIEFDKSLLDGFYKSYNPSFFLSELTLPSTTIPQTINLAGGQYGFGKYNTVSLPRKPIQLPIQNGHYQQLSQVMDPQLMVNQHYAFVQAEGANIQAPSVSQFNDVKPVQENQHEQQTQQSNRHEVVQKVQKENNHKSNENEKNTDKKKSRFVAAPISYRPRTHAIADKDYSLQRKLRPPPMIIIHQKY